MNWKEHTQQAASKGLAAFEALSRIATSTWGPSMKRSRLIYTATIRPAMLYGAQIWGTQDTGEGVAAGRLQPLKEIQNKCLRRVTGGYKRTPIAALEREADVSPLDLYADATALQRAVTTKDHPVRKDIARVVDTIWNRARRPNSLHTRRRQGRRPHASRPQTSLEKARERAEEREREILTYLDRRRERRRRDRRPKGSLIEIWANLEWRRRWTREANGKTPATWNTPWQRNPLSLYEGLPKHQATALLLLRTEVIGLKAWLASIRVPEILPQCDCGWQAQTVRHILLHCPNYAQTRPDLIRQTGSEDLRLILSRTASAQAAARWLTRIGILAQFNVACEIEAEDTTDHAPFQELV
jgi:hypothetical protein